MSSDGIISMLAALVMHSGGPTVEAMAAPVVASWEANGVQVYACVAGGRGAGPGWVLQRPEATLTDASGAVRAGHGAGPDWTATDGSRIVGQVVAAVPAGGGGGGDAIPWLALRVSSRSGDGVLQRVGYVLRTDTLGGVVPPDGCDGSRVGSVARVPYRAVYSFLVPREDARAYGLAGND